jgi:hypothetical protein
MPSSNICWSVVDHARQNFVGVGCLNRKTAKLADNNMPTNKHALTQRLAVCKYMPD